MRMNRFLLIAIPTLALLLAEEKQLECSSIRRNGGRPSDFKAA